jgi:A nuclease family of the HNH/ENDO VII superfamily with conserved AHH
MGNDAHKAYRETYRYHVKVGTYDDGACLVKHVVPFKDNDSCSYRWQGVEKAGRQPGKAAYDAHRNQKYHVGGRSAGPFEPQDATSVTASAGMAGKVVAAARVTKKGLRSIIEVTNFTTGWSPYGNQVHHLLNASSLRKGIDDLAEIWYPIRWVIVNGLLAEKYNLNHLDNNLILPTRDYHCRETGLPKHYGSHPTYSAAIKDAVVTALRPYETIANQMKKKKEHDKLEPEKLKDALVQISNTMYTNIINLAAANRTSRKLMSVNELPPAGFAGL